VRVPRGHPRPWGRLRRPLHSRACAPAQRSRAQNRVLSGAKGHECRVVPRWAEKAPAFFVNPTDPRHSHSIAGQIATRSQHAATKQHTLAQKLDPLVRKIASHWHLRRARHRPEYGETWNRRCLTSAIAQLVGPRKSDAALEQLPSDCCGSTRSRGVSTQQPAPATTRPRPRPRQYSTRLRSGALIPATIPRSACH
jgi:hypothetical protein